jgi:hypothetical protein
MKLQLIFLTAFLTTALARASLIVDVAEPKTVGQKSDVTLKLRNTFPQTIESARAVLFLVDDKGKMVGQGTKWVIGGSKERPPLEPQKETTYHFIVTGEKAVVATNLTARISFSRVVLEGGKLADPIKNVEVRNGK